MMRAGGLRSPAHARCSLLLLLGAGGEAGQAAEAEDAGKELGGHKVLQAVQVGHVVRPVLQHGGLEDEEVAVKGELVLDGLRG